MYGPCDKCRDERGLWVKLVGGYHTNLCNLCRNNWDRHVHKHKWDEFSDVGIKFDVAIQNGLEKEALILSQKHRKMEEEFRELAIKWIHGLDD